MRGTQTVQEGQEAVETASRRHAAGKELAHDEKHGVAVGQRGAGAEAVYARRVTSKAKERGSAVLPSFFFSSPPIHCGLFVICADKVLIGSACGVHW